MQDMTCREDRETWSDAHVELHISSHIMTMDIYTYITLLARRGGFRCEVSRGLVYVAQASPTHIAPAAAEREGLFRVPRFPIHPPINVPGFYWEKRGIIHPPASQSLAVVTPWQQPASSPRCQSPTRRLLRALMMYTR